MNPQDQKEVEKIAKDIFDKNIGDTIKSYLKTSAFVDRKVTDTPTEALSVVNRKFVTLNGATTSRPVSSVAVMGQHYFASDSSILMIYGGTGWVNSVGSIVALNN